LVTAIDAFRFSFLSLLPPRRPPRCTLCPYTTLFRSGLWTDRRPDDLQQHRVLRAGQLAREQPVDARLRHALHPPGPLLRHARPRSEEHTSELQSRENLVCRLLLEKTNTSGRETWTQP